MKKIVLVCMAIVFANVVKAQDVRFGIKTGMNISSINGSKANNIDSKTGMHIGVIAEVGFTDRFSIQPEIFYTAQGAKSRNQYTINLNYVAMPIMAKYYIAEGFSVEAGPQFSFLVEDEIVSNTGNASTANTNAENFELGGNIGLGYHLKNGLFFQTRYNLEVTTISENPDIYNGVFQLSLGFQF